MNKPVNVRSLVGWLCAIWGISYYLFGVADAVSAMQVSQLATEAIMWIVLGLFIRG